ncbi:MAG: alpha/beta hydrolase [Candidatus Hodarchaeota archaeon]
MNTKPDKLESLKKLAKPFFLENSSEIGVLLVHGFTASPTEMLPLGKYLHNKGYSIYGVCLAGHGTYYTDLQKYGWKDWFKSVTDGFFLLKEYCKTIIPIGISMGALLCLNLLQSHKVDEIPKIILLSPPFRLKSRLASLTPLLKYFIKFTYKGDKTLQYFLKHNLYSYLYRPTSSVAQFLKLQRTISKSMKMLTIPTMIAYGEMDDMISIPTVESMATRIKSTTKVEILKLPNSGHILTVEPDAEQLFDAISSFIDKTF